MTTVRESHSKIAIAAFCCLVMLAGCSPPSADEASSGAYQPGLEQSLYLAPPPGVETRWITGENPRGEKGAGGTTNEGAKGRAFIGIAPGETVTIFDAKGAGVINHIWMAGTQSFTPLQRRMHKIEMFWDGAEKPAVSVPLGDFFGMANGDLVAFESVMFSSPEGRSFNSFVPMPFRTSGRIELTNEGPYHSLVWYEVDYLIVDALPEDALYFHAYWSRDPKTSGEVDYVILPKVEGRGRYLGANIGLIGNPDLITELSWFGEGEVKIFLDGDDELATLVGTGTEDYVGTGFGQGAFDGLYFGSPISDKNLENKTDRYAFYRYHVPDPVYFHQDIRITIQTMGNMNGADLMARNKAGGGFVAVSLFNSKGQPSIAHLRNKIDFIKLLEENRDLSSFDEDVLAESYVNYWRKDDDVSATAYFYLDRPDSDLPRYTDPELALLGIPDE